MSRNLPLQIEMLAKRPGAFNNLVAFQEQTYDRSREGGSRSSFQLGELHFSIPEEIPLIGGDLLTPDLAFNDLLNRTNQLGELTEPLLSGQSAGTLEGFSNLGGFDPTAGLNVILGESSPWSQVVFEALARQDAFTGAELRGFERPITDDLELPGFDGPVNPVTEILGALLTPLGGARRTVNPDDPSESIWEFDELTNNTLQSFSPILNRISNINTQGDEGLRDRQIAAWLSFMFGGIRRRDDSSRLGGAFELSDEARRLLVEVENYSVPLTSELSAGIRSQPRGVSFDF